MTKSRLCDVSVIYVHETRAAIAVRETEDDLDLIWIPRSVCESDPPTDDLLGGEIITITLPESMAMEKGLI